MFYLYLFPRKQSPEVNHRSNSYTEGKDFVTLLSASPSRPGYYHLPSFLHMSAILQGHIKALETFQRKVQDIAMIFTIQLLFKFNLGGIAHIPKVKPVFFRLM